MTEILDITENEYRGLQMPSYSLLKKLDDSGPKSINRKYKYDSEAIDFGSLLDCRILCKDEFKNKFYFDATEKPTAQLLELADYVANLNEKYNQIFDVEDILRASDELNLFKGTIDPQKRINKFDTDLFWNYLKVRKESIGKTIFTPETLEECVEAEGILRSHIKTSHLFKETEDIEILTQVKFITEINGVKVKGMVDMIIIDHKNMTVTPYDLKATEYRQISFPYNFKKMKYYLQGGLYKSAVENLLRDVLNFGYSLEDFKFIVYSRSDKYPFIWNMSLEWHGKAIYGFTNEYGDFQKGINQLLEEYKFYVENDFYEIEKIIFEANYLNL